MSSERVTVEYAAKVLGLSIQSVRIKMDRDRFDPPIGHVIAEKGKRRKEYLIYKHMLNRYIGKGVY